MSASSEHERNSDQLHSLWFPRLQVRGAIVVLRDSVAEVWARGGYPPIVAQALGQSLAASALFISGMKSAGKLSIQLQEAGALRLLFAEATQTGGLRGIARMDPELPLTLFPAPPEARMAITIEAAAASEQRYQGIVPLEGDSLAAAFTGYFERSEQLPTMLQLVSDGEKVAVGLLLQRVPLSGGGNGEIDPDGWTRLEFLLRTLGTAELLATPPLELLRKLFSEEDVELIGSQNLQFACSCSRQRVADVLNSLGAEECEAALLESGNAAISITCEFCGQSYQFDRIEVASLFIDRVQAAPPQVM